MEAVVERHRWALAGAAAELDLWFKEGRRLVPAGGRSPSRVPWRARPAPGHRSADARTRLLALVWPELRPPDADLHSFEPMLDALDDLSPRIEAVDLGCARRHHRPRADARAGTADRGASAMLARRGPRPRALRDRRQPVAGLAGRSATRPERPEAPAAFRTLERDELAGLSLDLLPADAATRQRLALFGLVEMRQLAELPRSAVGAQFGPAGERSRRSPVGSDPRPLVPRRRPARVEAAESFDPPLDGIGAMGLTLRRLAADLCDVLRRRHGPGRAVLRLQLEDAPALRVAQAFPQPALEPDWIARHSCSPPRGRPPMLACLERAAGPQANTTRTAWAPCLSGRSGPQHLRNRGYQRG